MTTKDATMIAKGLAKGLKDADVLGHPDFELYTDKEKEMVLNAYRQLGTPASDKAPTPKTKKKAVKKVAKKSATTKKSAAKKQNGTDAQLRELILAGKTNADALKIVLAKNKGAKTTLACASWNRSQLRNNWKKYGFTKDPKVKTDREAAGN